MAWTRRALLRGGLAAAGAAVAWGGYRLVRHGSGLVAGLRSAVRRAASPALPAAPPGPLDPAALATLTAAAEAVLGPAAARAQYAELLRSRAAGLPGYRRLYERFAARLDAEAGARGLAALPRAGRLAVVTRLAPPGRPARLRLGLAGDERALFRRYVVVELLALYAATDAWTALGYPAWPGTPRGLRGYTRAVPGPASGR